MINPNLSSKSDKTYYSRQRNWPALFNIKPNCKILDIGCGQGTLGLFLKQEYQAEIIGLEIIEENFLIAKTVLDRVVLGDIETIDLNDLGHDFDYIIFSDSLEHLLEPEKVVLRIKTLLKKDSGELLISLPNIRNFRVTLPLLLLDEWRYTDEGLLDKTHLRFFTLRSITRLLEQSGLSIKRIEFDLPVSSKSGLLNLLSLGILRKHLTSHYFIQSCLKAS